MRMPRCRAVTEETCAKTCKRGARPREPRNLEARPRQQLNHGAPHPEQSAWAIGRLRRVRPRKGAPSAAFVTAARYELRATMDTPASAQRAAAEAAAPATAAAAATVAVDTDKSKRETMTRMNSIYLTQCVAAGLAAAVLLHAAPPEIQRTFATPLDAIQATIDAAEHNDAAALLQLFGPDGKDILESGDPAQDKEMRADFARSAHEKLQIEQDPANPDRVTFAVGEQDWPFPVPVVRRDGKWRLDPVGGRMEILARRVGRNELNAIEICRGYAEAQLDYASEDRDRDGVLEYAQTILSSPGKQDGLYSDNAAQNLVAKAFAAASAAKPEPYHGYYFRVLKSQGPEAGGGAFDYVVNGKMIGGFALVAWPAEYGVSGVQTFIINHEGLVYGKDLGMNTPALARQTTRFNPDRSWRRFDSE